MMNMLLNLRNVLTARKLFTIPPPIGCIRLFVTHSVSHSPFPYPVAWRLWGRMAYTPMISRPRDSKRAKSCISYTER